MVNLQNAASTEYQRSNGIIDTGSGPGEVFTPAAVAE